MNLTSMKPFRPDLTLLLAAPALFFAGSAFTHAQSDRPPWAQKPKSASSANSNSKPNSSSAPAAAPSTAPEGEPGKIVQPTSVDPVDGPQDPAAQRGRIRVNVLDDKNRPAPDLPKEAFQLFEEGVEQKIDKFEPETSQPLDLAIMIDSSLSAHKEISFEQEAAAHFIRQVLRPGDRLSVFAFDENVTQLASFSDNVAA